MSWKTYKVQEIVTEIAARTYVLPVVQRRLVWEADKMELLFDTLLKGDPFGGIMVIEDQPGNVPLFESRPFSLHGETLQSKENSSPLLKKTFFVIDGQQRLQTLYMGLLGQLEGSELYFDLYSDHTRFFDFRFSSAKLPSSVSDAEDAKNRPIKERKWIRVTDLYDSLNRRGSGWPELVYDLLDGEDDRDIQKEKAVRANITAFWSNLISESRLGIDSVSLDQTQNDLTNRQRIVELFRRLNDGGTPLSSYDLFASLLKGFHWEMEGFLDEMLGKHRAMGLNQDNLIKLVFILTNEPRKELVDVNSEDADFAVRNRARISQALELTRTFVKAAKLEDYFNSGNRSFIPLFFITHYLFYKGAGNDYFSDFDTAHPDFKQMRNWVFHSFLNSSFRSRGVGWNPSKTGISRILEVMNQAKGGEFPLDKLLGVYRHHLHVFTLDYRQDEIELLDRDFVYYVIYGCERPPGRDQDHIHPRSRLDALGVSHEKIHSTANFQLLDPSTNRGAKQGSLFNDWLHGTIGGKPNVDDIPAYLERHLIPTDPALHQIGNFDAFLDARSKLISEKIRKRFQS